jgi:hypothetical protein
MAGQHVRHPVPVTERGDDGRHDDALGDFHTGNVPDELCRVNMRMTNGSPVLDHELRGFSPG